MAQKERDQKRREKRAEVDHPVKCLEHHPSTVLVSLIELIANKCGDTRFDSARAECNQRKTDVKAHAMRDKHRQACLARAVNQAQPKDRVVFTKKSIS